MKVLMLGWEFPPFISGGLGTACYGLTKGLNQLGAEVLFLLPKPVDSNFSSHVKLVSPSGVPVMGSYTYQVPEFENVTFRTVDARIAPYQTPEEYTTNLRFSGATTRELEALAVAGIRPVEHRQATPAELGKGGGHYGGDLFSEVDRYARLATLIASQEEFDVIHAHDWMTYRAGIAVAAMTGKPLVVHIHSTEFDRSGEHVNQTIYDIERQGLHFARRVIAVSYLTKSIVASRYAVPPEKVDVVYNAIEFNGNGPAQPPDIQRDEKLVLFLGRITMQKGPEYFLAAARKVLDVMDNVRFIMAGWGDMIRRTIELAHQMGISDKVLFTGFLRGKDVDRVFQMADLYVMPSVSEPFGIAPLEAMNNDVPVIISKQSGVSEVLSHALKVDFWDVNEMANKIVAVLRHPPLQNTLREHGKIELRKLSWTDSAQRCINVYKQAINAN
jgi:glycogen(starch) synthase